MPLTQLPLRGTEDDNVEQFHDSLQVQHRQASSRCGTEDEEDSGYEDFTSFDEEDECIDSEMEGSVIHRPRPKKANKMPPPLPQRNERRASRILDDVMLELKNLDGKASKQLKQRSVIDEEDPHESYLSSEEDASLSDDYDDSELDLDPLDSNEVDSQGGSRPSTSKSQEDTARIVSFVVGKPQIIDIFYYSPTTANQRHTVALDELTSTRSNAPTTLRRSKPMHRPSPLNLFPATSRRRSVSSVASNATSSTTNTHSNGTVPAPTHSTSYIAPSKQASKSVSNLHSSSQSINILPPRKSSRITENLHNLKTSLTQSLTHHTPITSSSALPQSSTSTKHSFLNMDPFEAAHVLSPTTPSSATSRHSFHQQTPTTPKTPTGTSSSSWRISHGLSRTLSRARKPSMPKLSQAYTNSGVSETSQTSLPSSESTTSLAQHPEPRQGRQSEEESHIKMMGRRSMTMPLRLTQQLQQNPEDSTNMEKTSAPSIKESRKGALGAMIGLGRKKNAKTAV